jgi:diacylglycerol kinase
MKSKKFIFKSRMQSFRFALNGLKLLLLNEHNSRIHLAAAIAAVCLGLIVKIDLYEWSLLILVISIVFVTELINSAIESLADHIDKEWNELIMKAKDYSAAAVFVSAIAAFIVGCLIFIPKLLALTRI